MNSLNAQSVSTAISSPDVSISAFSSEYLNSRWYAAHTNPRHEKSVLQLMEQNQIDCFLPLYKSVRRWKDRRKRLDLPLFPGYIFVHIALKDRLSALRIPGVVQLVSFQGKPAAVPDGEIEALRNGLRGSIGAEPHPYLKIGKRVRVNNGPLCGVEGILERRKDKFRVVLSIHLIQRSVAVEVDEGDIELAN
jgi:transcription antitermination factor NusG